MLTVANFSYQLFPAYVTPPNGSALWCPPTLPIDGEANDKSATLERISAWSPGSGHTANQARCRLRVSSRFHRVVDVDFLWLACATAAAAGKLASPSSSSGDDLRIFRQADAANKLQSHPTGPSEHSTSRTVWTSSSGQRDSAVESE